MGEVMATRRNQDVADAPSPASSSLNPFPFFRAIANGKLSEAGDEEVQDEETDDEEPNGKVVYRGWDRYRGKAVVRYANSKLDYAIGLKHGGNGFVTAVYGDGVE